jgi:hypothetical protein
MERTGIEKRKKLFLPIYPTSKTMTVLDHSLEKAIKNVSSFVPKYIVRACNPGVRECTSSVWLYLFPFTRSLQEKNTGYAQTGREKQLLKRKG